MKTHQQGGRRVLFTLGALALGLLLFASPVLAAGPHKFSKSLEAPTGGFSGPWGLAVGPAGEVFVSNNASSVIDVYNSTGTFETEFPVEVGAFNSDQIAVDDSATSSSKGDVYIGTFEGKVLKYEYNRATKIATKATSITATEPIAVAVDSHGDVYVTGSGTVNKYGPEGKLITEKVITGLSGYPISIAVDNDPSSPAYEDIFVGDSEGVHEYSESGMCLNGCAAFGGVTTTMVGITVGPEGYVYVDPEESSEETSVFEANGTLVESFDSAHLIYDGNGIGVSGTTVFVTSDNKGEVAEFTPSGELLTVKKTGTGKGTVTSEEQPGINCGTECSSTFAEDENVKLIETAAPGSNFTKWEGCTAEASGVCEVTMGTAKEVKAEYTANTPVGFTPAYAGAGTGEVKCEVDKEGGFVPCASEYGEGTELVIEGSAVAGSMFEGWSAGTGSASSCTGTGRCAFTIAEATTLTATFGKAVTSPLSVYVTGEGKVNSSPAGIAECTSTGGVCEAEFKGLVTLTATPETGYVLVGWIGCKKTTEVMSTEATCEVNVTAASEVTAVFLKEGKEGKEGTEGQQGKEGKPGEGVKVKGFGPEEHGCEEGGIEVVSAEGTTYVCSGPFGEEGKEGRPGTNGMNGVQGTAGASGEKGAIGATGTQGPAGPAGPAGKEGPPGKVELVTCKKVGKKQKCTTKTVAGTVTFTTSSARAMLSRHGVVYAAGTASASRHGRMSLRLISLRKLHPGRYTLTLIGGSGRHETIRSETFMLR